MRLEPFKVRVDWTCHNAYGDAVDVELHILGAEAKVIHRADTPLAAVAWAQSWLTDRGFRFVCLIGEHQRRDDTHITLFPTPPIQGEE